jgi:Tol biopolymer transport system component
MIPRWFEVISIASLFCAPSFAQSTTRLSVDSGGAQGDGFSLAPSITPDGRFVAFGSYATNLVPGDSNGTADVFVRDLVSGTITRVSVSSNGTEANGLSGSPSISSDGRYVAFSSSATNLVPGNPFGYTNAYVHDMVTGATTRMSVDSNGSPGNVDSYSAAISSDGRYVLFSSDSSNLVPGDTNGFLDVFVHDRVTGSTTRASVDSSGAEGNHNSFASSISADGRYVAFWSIATNLVVGDTNGREDVFVHDMVLGITTRVSVSSSGVQGNKDSGDGALSSDGRYVAFSSASVNLVPGDGNNQEDVFVHDMVSGATERVSVDSNGAQCNGGSGHPSISPDGRFVAFYSNASDLVPGDAILTFDVFVHDRLSGATTCVSVDSNGVPGNGSNNSPSTCAISADGRYTAFASDASNLVPADTNGTVDVFVRDLGAASAFVSMCFGDGTGGSCPCGNTGSPGHGCENSAATGGALLAGSGVASLSSDSVQLGSSGELPTALSIVLQGNSVIAPTTFGDGLRCAGGSLKRLYVKHAIGGAITAPEAGDPTISARSATLGDSIPLGATRAYQVYYRDPNLAFCPGGFNVSSAIAIAWGS